LCKHIIGFRATGGCAIGYYAIGYRATCYYATGLLCNK
jgi:hypothetical protein